MGSLTSITKWIAEDDLLLKNAVEAGASLESLGKGAVPFSRRFTMRELRDRWHSLLYDLDTSTEASARIVEIEIDLTASNLPKSNRACNPCSKVKETLAGKRKVDSVKSHYYAMRKKIRSEPCATNLSFLEPSALFIAAGSSGSHPYQLKPQIKPPADDFGLQAPFSSGYRHPETGHDIGGHAFPEQMRVDSVTGNGCSSHRPYDAGQMVSAGGDIADRTSPEGLFAYPGNISSAPCDGPECNNGNQSFDHNFHQRDFPHILGENLIDSSSDSHEMNQANILGRSSPFKSEGTGDNPHSCYDTSNANHEGVCADFVKANNLSSHVSEYGCSSSPSGMPAWKTLDDKSASILLMDGHYGDKEHRLLDMDEHKNITAGACNVTPTEPKLDDGMCGGLHNPATIHSDDFMDFSNTYMDFSSDENLLFIDVNEEDSANRSCPGLSSILRCPSDTHHDVPNEKGLRAENVELEVRETECAEELTVTAGQMNSSIINDQNTSVSCVNKMPLTTLQPSEASKLQEKFMICSVNSQDFEVPDNDHVILCPLFSSSQEHCSRDINGLVSTDNALSIAGRDPFGDLNKVKEQLSNVPQSVSPSKDCSASLPKVGCLHSSDGCAAKADQSSKGGSISECCRFLDGAVDESKHCKLEAVDKLKDETECSPNLEYPDASFASFLEHHLQEVDDSKAHQLNASTQVGNQALHSNLVSGEGGILNTDAITSTSDQEHFSDSEDDVPYFSDIEAMILDMDLGPYDEEACLMSKEASRFRHIDMKNTIRWEQSFLSHINRSILSQGAFAVFYGRHLKYFIKEFEVVIGRETSDHKVHIDLSREGRANKVSRRQATIKLDEEGAFSLKNVGKFSIFVNGKEVPAKKRINLLSHSLIKIMDMYFAFEVNENAVRNYAKKPRRCSQELSSLQ